jgi:hypothetical protein
VIPEVSTRRSRRLRRPEVEEVARPEVEEVARPEVEEVALATVTRP